MKPRFAQTAFPFALVIVASSAFAADASFTAIQYTNLGWDNNSIWTPAAFPGLKGGTGNTDTATFANEGSHLITLPNTGGLVNAGNLVFSTPGATPNTYIFNSNSLLLSAGGAITAGNTFTGRIAFNNGTTLQGSGSFTGSGANGSAITLNAVTTDATLGNVTLTLNGSNVGSLNIASGIIAGVISEGTGTTLALVKDGAGTWTLGNNNTYTGGTTLKNGTLITGTGASGTPFGSTGTITIDGNPTIRTTNNAPTDYSSRITITNGSNLTLDTGNITHTWAGILGNSGGSNTAGITKTGIGQLSIIPAAGAVQTYKGDTTVNMGLLTISGANQTGNFSNLIDPSSDLVLGGGALQFIGKATFTNSQAFASTTLNAGISELRPASSTGTNTLSLGNITRNTGALLNIVNATGYTWSTSLADGFVKGVVFSSNDLARVNAGNLAAATYTTQNDASLWTDSGTNYVTNGAVSSVVGTGGTVDINGLKLNNGSSQSFSIDGTLRVNGGVVFGSSIAANASEISGGSLTSTSGELILVCNNAQNTYGRNTISSTIVDNGGATDVIIHVPINNGTLFLSGNNTYTGNTYIGGNSNSGTGSSITTIGGVSGAKIGSAGKTVHVNGGGAANPLGNVLRVGNNDATGDVLGTIQLDNGRLSLNRNDTFTLGAEIAGTRGGGYISQDNATGNATVKFAAGNNVFAGLRGVGGGVLNLTGPGSVNTFGLMAWDSGAAGNNGALNGVTLNFKSGTYFLSGTSNNGNNGGVTLGVDGANVVWGGARWFGKWGATVNVSSGRLSINSGRADSTDYANVNPLVFNISGTGVFEMASGTWHLSGKADPASVSATANQTGGEANIGLVAATNATIGSTANLTIGIAGASHASTYNLSGGVLRVANTLAAGGAPSGGSNNFNWTGGRLNVRTINTGNLTGNTVANTLVQNGAGAILSPGDSYNSQVFSGLTTITGDYTLTTGKLAIGIGGTVQANSYHDSPAEYDTVAVSGTATLGAGAQLEVTLNNDFTPANTDTFTILTGGTVSGTFNNLSGGKVTLAGGATFDVTVNPASVVLSNYQAAPGGDDYSTWATDNGIGGEPFDGDFDKDGISNGMEYALGKSPTVSSQPPGVLAGNVVTFTKGAEAIANGDVSWVIETSTTLAANSWTAEVTQAAGDTNATIAYTFTPGSPAKKFARLKVVQVP